MVHADLSAEGDEVAAEAAAQHGLCHDGDGQTVEEDEELLEEGLVQDADGLEPARVQIPDMKSL